MLTNNDVKELLAYQANSPVLSVYLNTEPEQGNADAYKLRLRSMLKEVDLPEDVFAIMRYVDHQHDWSGRSLAIFSCAAEGFFRAYPIAMPVRSRMRVEKGPYVKPLADLMDSYGGYGVVLVDKQGVRLFYFHLGELKEQEGFIGEEVRHVKRGGGSQAPGRKGGTAGQTNYAEELAERNVRDFVDIATHFFTENNVRRVVIGGTEDNVALFRSLLPKAWQSLVVGTFPITMLASQNEVLERAMQIGAQAERVREGQLLDAIVTSAAKGHGGAVNLSDTLTAIHEGRVQTLVYQDGYRAPGCRCKGCGYLSAEFLGDGCPFCGSECEEISDAVELAVRQVMQTGGEVEVLHDAQYVAGFNQIGALLRY